MSDSTELVHTVGTELEHVPVSPSGMLQSLLDLAARPDTDAAKASAVYALAKEMMADEAKRAWTKAFMSVRDELDGITIRKNGQIHYEAKPGKAASTIKFMKNEDIARAIKPVLRKFGMAAAYTYRYESTPPKTICVMKLMHNGGHTELFESPPMPMVDDGGGKNAVQGAGSVGSYGRRYVVCPTFDIIAEGEDDDGSGKGVSDPITEEQIEVIRNIVQACDDKSPGSRGRFVRWMRAQLKVEKPADILQGSQHDQALAQLKDMQINLGLLKK